MIRLPIFSIALTLLSATPTLAQGAGAMAGMDKPACAAPGVLPEALASWASPVPLSAATGKGDLKAAVLKPGQAVAMALRPTPTIQYPLRPAKPGGSVSYGGLAAFTVDQAGRWRVALGSGAWVDVVSGKTAMISVAHGHGPDCTGVRKMVDYDLKPGRYVLQVAANGTDSLPVLVTRLP